MLTADSTAHAISTRALPQVRRLDLDFDPSAVPRDWYAGDLHLSAFWNGLSLLFPEGEKFFVDSVRRYGSRLSDPELKKRVNAFIGQEAMHGAEHRAFNAMLRAQGDEGVVRLERELRGLLWLGRHLLRPKAQLGITCALEHYTAILAEQLLELPEHQASIHPSMRSLWLWHALEESEHKTVAYDVFQAVGGTYFTRIATMLIASVFFAGEVVNVFTRLLWKRGLLFDLRGWGSTIRFLCGKTGLFRRVTPAYLAYFRPSFHPADRDTEALVETWSAHFAAADKNARGRATAPPTGATISPLEPSLAAAF
jgi:predicted metal-dependent hydrolase